MWVPLRGFMYGPPPPPRSLICAPAQPGLNVSARAAYPALAVQGRRGEGRQGPQLLLRVL